jgi:hypothetical protein
VRTNSSKRKASAIKRAMRGTRLAARLRASSRLIKELASLLRVSVANVNHLLTKQTELKKLGVGRRWLFPLPFQSGALTRWAFANSTITGARPRSICRGTCGLERSAGWFKEFATCGCARRSRSTRRRSSMSSQALSTTGRGRNVVPWRGQGSQRESLQGSNFSKY